MKGSSSPSRPTVTGTQAGVPDRLAGRRVLVLGAGATPTDEPDPPPSNGRAIAITCAMEGAHVFALDVHESSAAETAALIHAAGGSGSALVADATDPVGMERALSDVSGIDGLVLNVGAAFGVGLEETTLEDWDRAFALNVRSHFLAASLLVPRMAAGGALVFVSSVGALRSSSNRLSYDASKAAVAALSRDIAFAYGDRGIRSNVVVLGLMDTPLGRAASRRRPERDLIPIPLGRSGSGWDAGAAVAFLLSDAASYITAHELVVDGGITTRL